jgi:hypothetical protein
MIIRNYTENYRSRNWNPTKYRGWTQNVPEGKQFLSQLEALVVLLLLQARY